MINRIAIMLAFLVLAGGVTSNVYAEENAEPTALFEFLDTATLENLASLSEPTEQHQLLSSLSGTWDYTLYYWAKENSQAQTSSGAMVNEMILDNQYLSSKTALILNIGGENISYEGQGMIGFDRSKNIFTSVWADTMLSDLMSGSGEYNSEQKTIVEKGVFNHPLMEGEQAYRSELQFVNDDTYKQMIFINDSSGKAFKVLEIEFHKRK